MPSALRGPLDPRRDCCCVADPLQVSGLADACVGYAGDVDGELKSPNNKRDQ